jgi:hypothetical protein
MREVDQTDREAVRFWGDPVRALLMEAEPGSDLFDDVYKALSQRTAMADNPYLTAADVRAVMAEHDLTVPEFAGIMGVPPAYANGIVNGWKRLSPKGLADVARCLGVPMGAFFHDGHFRERWRVREYRAFERAQTVVHHLI